MPAETGTLTEKSSSQKGLRLAVRVQAQRIIRAAVKSPVKKKIRGVQLTQQIALHRGWLAVCKMFCRGMRRQLIDQY